MKKILLGIIAFITVMPMLAQVQISKVYGTYPGYTQIGINTPLEISKDKKRASTATLIQSELKDRVNITLSGFDLGKYVFKKLVLENITLVQTEDGYTFSTSNMTYPDTELKDNNGTYSIQISIDPGVKGTIKNGVLEIDLTINFRDLKLYTHFKGEMTTTGIYKIQTENKRQDEIYDLTGKRVNKTRKGIYIINGKKVVVR